MSKPVTRAELRQLRLTVEGMWYVLLDLEERSPLAEPAQRDTPAEPPVLLPPVTDEHVEAVLAEEGYYPKRLQPNRAKGRGPQLINGPQRGDIHDRIMDEIAAVLAAVGHAVTSREIQAHPKAALIRQRYRDAYHGIAAITTHIRQYGRDWDIVEAKHPSGSRRAIAWYFRTKGKRA